MASQPKKLVLDHDDLIAALIKVRNQIERAKVVAAFVVSLQTKRLDWRSPLGSYAFHLNHPRHKLSAFKHISGSQTYLQCKRCPYFSNQGRRELEVNFGYYAKLRNTSKASNFYSLAYALADLTLFSEADVPSPDEDGWDVMRQLLQRVRNLPRTARLGDLQRALTGLFKSDRYARQQVLEILGFCGIVQPKSRPLVTDRFFYLDRDQFHPHFNTRDWAYPVSWWTGADGVNDAAVAFWFPEEVR